LKNVFRADPFPGYGHASDHLLQTLGLEAPELPDLWVPGHSRVVLHPGSGGTTKIWPYFQQLADTLPDVAIVRGPQEAGFRCGRTPVVETPSLLELAREICCSRIFVGNDSGITHLAAYWGAPTVALFGPTDPGVWGPVGRRVRILAKSSLAGISIDEVRMLLT
jgi:ADP-heptose:LPS heptosyltransferase